MVSLKILNKFNDFFCINEAFIIYCGCSFCSLKCTSTYSMDFFSFTISWIEDLFLS